MNDQGQQLFTVNKAKTRAFCEALIEADLPVEWSCFTRSDCVDPELLTLMHKSGCNTVLIGVESGSQRIQDLIRKKTRVDEVSAHIDMVVEHGIKPQLSYIVGFPEETAEDLQATIDMYFRYKFAADRESQIGLLVPAGGTEVLTANADDLDFDGVQTTTWYTRFFDEDSYGEMAALPGVYPHNHFVRTQHLSRDLLLFVKIVDMATSYLTTACRYAVSAGLLRMPFETYAAYSTWRDSLPTDRRWAPRWDGKLGWRTDVSSVIADFAQFLTEVVAPTAPDAQVLIDLVAFDMHRSMLNLRLRERSWDALCAAAPAEPDDNPVTDADAVVEFVSRHGYAGLVRFVESGLDPQSAPEWSPVPRINTLAARGPDALVLTERGPEGVIESTYPVFRQIEF